MTFTHLILSGGGSHGVVLVGGLRALDEKGFYDTIKYVSCSSIGSFIGLMVGLKLSINEIEKIIKNTIADENVCFIPKKNIWNAIGKLGITNTKYIVNHLKKYLRDTYQIQDLTFEEVKNIYGTHLYISTTNISKSHNTIFSYENTPNNSIFSACEASMSIPFLYERVKIDNYYYYDGGLSNNFPISIFEDINDDYKIGLALNGKEIDINSDNQDDDTNITFYKLVIKIVAFLKIIIRKETMMKHINKDFVLIYEDIPTNWIELELQDTKLQLYRISPDDIDKMLQCGYNYMNQYLEKRIINTSIKIHKEEKI